MVASLWFGVAGDESATPAVLVHGSMDRSAGLLRLSRRLDATHRVVRYDRRGYGRSATIGPPWTIEANVGDLEELLESVGTAPATLFGHSFGGNVALALAARRPDLVNGVVVYETPLSWLEWWPGNSAGAAAIALDDPGDAAEAFMRRLVGDAVWERLPESTQRERRAEGAAMVAELADLRRRAPWDGAGIEVPVLALYGEEARPHHRTAMAGMVDMIPQCVSAMVPGAGHAGPHTHAGAVVSAIEHFLVSLSGESTRTAG
jgi:pimeloyl-ACP methyl ester carboxylesterase